MVYRTFYFCCAVMLLASCNSQQHDPLAFEPPIFPETKQIIVTHLPNDFLFRLPADIVDLGTHLAVQMYHANGFIHIFDKESGVFVKSFGSRGRGPDEFTIPPTIRTNEDKTELYAFQLFNGMHDYWTYDVRNILEDNLVRPVRKEEIVLYLHEGQQYSSSAQDFLAWQDKRLFDIYHFHRFEIQDTLGNTLYTYNEYPKVRLKEKADSIFFRRSYTSAPIALKPDMSKFVTASHTGCIMEIFDLEASGKMEKIVEKRFFPPIFEAMQGNAYPVAGETVSGMYDLSATDELIFGMYHGKTFYMDDRDFINTIAVFDWLGNPVRRYDLNWCIESFVVDAKRNRCYLVGVCADEDVVLGYFDL